MLAESAFHPFIPVPEDIALGKLRHRSAVRFIILRDGIACWLCGLAVDLHAPATDARAATIDHIVPRAQKKAMNGTFNYRLAHARCNASREHYWPETMNEQGRAGFIPSPNGIWARYELLLERRKQAKIRRKENPPDAIRDLRKKALAELTWSAWEAYDRACAAARGKC